MTHPQTPLAITGMSSISGFGIDAAAFAAHLRDGDSAIRPYPGAGQSRARTAGHITGFAPEAFVPPARLRRIDRVGRLAIAGARLALADARIDVAAASDSPTDLAAADVGVVLGSYTAGLHSLIEYLDRLIAQGPPGASALDFSNTVGNAAASLCGIELGLRGPNITVNNKEASGLAAVAQAASLLWSGQARAIVTGGTDDFEPTFFAVHDRFGVLAHDAGSGELARPFDRRRNGFVMGNGSFLVVLETLASAAARGTTPVAILRAVVGGAAPAGLNQWPDDPAPIAQTMRRALDAGGAAPEDVAFVVASANASRGLDRVEAQAIAAVFGAHGVPVVSLKGALGESGAAGAAGLLVAGPALRDGIMPPTLQCDERDVDCPVDVAPRARRFEPRPGQVVLVNSIASGGALYCAVAGRPGPSSGPDSLMA